MHSIKRGVAVAAVALLAWGLCIGSAAATISPNPYSTARITGRVNTIWSLGNGNCNVVNGEANASGSSGVVTNVTFVGCSGYMVSARFARPMTITTSLVARTVTVDFSYELGNIYGGQCQYAGTLRGVPNGTSTITVSGTLLLYGTLRPVCEASSNGSMTVTLPGATIT